ncbi:MAG: ComF family protein [Cyanobacteria bacterium SIG26]|nr:ComF family protein [Cyanobacteria bacterium SIG26]
MKKFFENLLDWIYKKKCYFCKSSKESVRMCSQCFDELDFLPVKINRKIYNSEIYCAGIYNKNLQKMIRGLKYHRQSDLAYYQAKFMYQYWERLNIEGDFQIIPVPIYPKRKKQRKYNHMDLIAEEFAQMTGYEVNTNLIKRIKDTKPQYKLNKAQRMLNLSKAFEVDKSAYIEDKKVLIIDDICTTGSTFEEMIKELNNVGIYDIVCFATTTPFN